MVVIVEILQLQLPESCLERMSSNQRNTQWRIVVCYLPFPQTHVFRSGPVRPISSNLVIEGGFVFA